MNGGKADASAKTLTLNDARTRMLEDERAADRISHTSSKNGWFEINLPSRCYVCTLESSVTEILPFAFRTIAKD